MIDATSALVTVNYAGSEKKWINNVINLAKSSRSSCVMSNIFLLLAIMTDFRYATNPYKQTTGSLVQKL